jgi:hypothetical protein
MRKYLMISTVLVTIAAAGCGGEEPSGAQPPLTTTAGANSPPPSPTPSPTPEPEPVFALGDQQDNTSGGTVTVFDYQQPVAQEAPQPVDAQYPDDYVWAGLEVEVCVPDEPQAESSGYYITRSVWRLAFPDNSLVDSSHTGYSGFPQPEYPWGDTPVELGQCVRGWLVFPVPGDDQPEMAQYTGGGLLEWQLTDA